jgi:hypothetical protein
MTDPVPAPITPLDPDSERGRELAAALTELLDDWESDDREAAALKEEEAA